VAAFALAGSVAVAAISMLTYEAWWALSSISFGIVVFGLERRGLSLAAAFALAAVVAASLLSVGMGLWLIVISQSGIAHPCDPGPCTNGIESFVVGGFALLSAGIVGLILSARWLRARPRRSAPESPQVGRTTDIRRR